MLTFCCMQNKCKYRLGSIIYVKLYLSQVNNKIILIKHDIKLN